MTTPAPHPTTNVYYWPDVPNFGDRMAKNLLDHFANVDSVWSDIPFADVLVTGSVLEKVPADYSGIVAGTGILVEKSRVTLENANVLAVRGPLSLERLTCANKSKVVLGDPGLLGNELVNVTTRDQVLGVLPHWTDTRLRNDGTWQQYNPLFISPFDDPLTVIANVGRCQKLVTSSLHGLILADAFGIPRRYERSPRMLPEEGGMFKFRDYHKLVGLPMVEGVSQTADPHKIADIQHTMFDMFETIRASLG